MASRLITALAEHDEVVTVLCQERPSDLFPGGTAVSYRVRCTCGYLTHLATGSDESATRFAQEHLGVHRPVVDPFEGLC